MSSRFRRSTDVVLLTLSLVLVAVASAQVGDPGDLETAFSDWLAALPGFLDVVWASAFDFLQIWVVVIGILALTRQRSPLPTRTSSARCATSVDG